MINRFYLEDFLSFENVDLEFEKGLIVFSGSSGVGKSILMNAILSLFGANDSKSRISEVCIENINITNESYNINNDEFTIKQTRSLKTRYFLNNQSISKKSLNKFTKNFFKYLHLRDTSDFDSINIIEFLNYLIAKDDKEYINILNNFKVSFNQLKELKDKLQKAIEDENNIEDIKELITIQIKTIEEINPIDGEYEELKSLKDIFSQKDKIDEILLETKPLIDNSHKISQALNIININSDFFDIAINEVNNVFENFYDKLNNYEDTNIENTLDRIENLSKLIKKYGSINEALEFKEKKKIELKSYENISFEKEILIKNIKKLELVLSTQSELLSDYRKDALEILKTTMNKFLKYLYLNNLDISITNKPLDINGKDFITFTLNNINLEKISSGEFNRLRLALLTSRSLYEINTNGILFLDEIDANLSGKESESIANVLSILSKRYQIFVISHQPQLSATANQHFLVTKQNNISKVYELNKVQRIDEISRMISGENISYEAKIFAKQLLKD
jgi:DNA repair protein RecN (Recombination protein N)